MCPTGFWAAVACFSACWVFIAVVVRLDAWRETNRRRRLMADALERYEQSQHTWRESPVVDRERRA